MNHTLYLNYINSRFSSPILLDSNFILSERTPLHTEYVFPNSDNSIDFQRTMNQPNLAMQDKYLNVPQMAPVCPENFNGSQILPQDPSFPIYSQADYHNIAFSQPLQFSEQPFQVPTDTMQFMNHNINMNPSIGFNMTNGSLTPGVANLPSPYIPITPNFQTISPQLPPFNENFSTSKINTPKPIAPKKEIKTPTVTPRSTPKPMENHQGKFVSNIGPKQAFECDVCGKNFNRKYVWKRHLRSHSNEKNYHCHLCQVSFHRKDIYDRHTTTKKCKKAHHQMMCIRNYGIPQFQSE